MFLVKRKYMWMTLGCLSLALLTGVIFSIANAKAIKVPKEFNLLGTVHHIGTNNQRLNQENKSILTGMDGIDALAGKTEHMDKLLHQIRSSFPNQTVDLANLNSLSQEQVTLSAQLHNYAANLNQSLSTVSANSTRQNGDMNRLVRSSEQLRQQAAKLYQTNQVIAGKLSTAAQKTAQADSEIP